jgi:hypothetical protein
MRGNGIKATELIAKLQELVRQHGDREMWNGGADYPEPITQVTYRTAPDSGYLPTKVFVCN